MNKTLFKYTTYIILQVLITVYEVGVFSRHILEIRN
jgi:hypothetical protein